MKYTFSLREKILLALLVAVGFGVAWYQLVFVNVENQVANLDSQISAAQEEALLYQSHAASMSSMREAIADYKARGVTPVLLPAFDNTQNLMAYLNSVLGSTRGYSISFVDPELDEDDGSIHRSATITFGSSSYAEARAVIQSIAQGPYPCQIDSLGINDSSAKGGDSSGTTCSTTIQVTFFEVPPSGMTVTSEEEEEVEGQDLSILTNWNEQ